MAVVAACVVAGVSSPASGEEARRWIPVLGLHLAPSMSVVMDTGSSGAVTSVYGQVHPAGALGLSVHPSERVALVVDLEAEGWSGRLEAPDAPPIELRFLSYWLHARARTRIARLGPVGIHVDAAVGIGFSREDGSGFRAEGDGFSFGAGPLVDVALGRYLALSLGILFEGGWVWYEVDSAAAREGPNEYTMSWPRVLFSLGLHGFIIHRLAPRARGASAEPPAEPRAEPELEEPTPSKSPSF